MYSWTVYGYGEATAAGQAAVAAAADLFPVPGAIL